MSIPSYDDLTPPIPDVTPRETFAIDRIMPASGSAPCRGLPRAGSTTSAGLFACLRSRRSPGAIVSIARDFSPRVERFGTSAVVFDISGLGRLLGGPDAIGDELARVASPHAGMSVAIAATQVAAMVVSLARPCRTVVTGDAASALAPLPLPMLQQLVAEAHGVADVRRTTVPVAPRRSWPAWPPCASAFAVLQRWGLKTIGELAVLPAADLSERLGQAGVALHRLARGFDPAPLVPDPGVPRFVQRMELEWPIDALEPLSFVLARLLEPLSAALERADRGAAALRLDLRLVDRTTYGRVLQLPAAMRDPRVLRTLLLLDLEAHPPAAAIDIITIEIDPAPGRIVQYSLLERAMPSPETIATLTARLGALVGETRIGSPALVDTHRPDGFEMQRFDPKPSRCVAGPRTPGLRDVADPRTPGLRNVADPHTPGLRDVADPDTPDLKVGPTVALRRFRPPVAIRVTVDGGRPVHVAIDRKGMPGGRVERAAGPWRTSGAWWNPDAARWDRDEWDVALADTALCRLFRDRTTGRWFMDGVID